MGGIPGLPAAEHRRRKERNRRFDEETLLADGTRLGGIIDHLPPVALFGLYEILQRIPDWQDIPQNLADLYDEIGDAEAFSLELPGASAATAASVVTAKAGPAGGQGAFGSATTKTDIFCSKGKQPRWDTVRLNRLKAFFVLIKSISDAASEFAPDWYTLTVLGEGASIPIPLKGGLEGGSGRGRCNPRLY